MNIKDTEKLEHCCEHMDKYVTDRENDLLIDYESCVRSYCFRLYHDGKYLGAAQEFWYCPWCGGKLPDDLNEKWGELLEQEHGFISDDHFFNENGQWDESLIPEEFRTDEWWKKRGLQNIFDNISIAVK